MKISATSLPDVFRVQPEKIPDRRGTFHEAFRTDELSEAIGRKFEVKQVNFSVSHRNTLRGIHGSITPPGQAKLVTCVRGAVLDVVVDLRIGSPTYGEHLVTLQTAESGLAVYMAEGLGHGFLALTDDTCINYVCNVPYTDGSQIAIDPLDPALGIPWELHGEPIRSDKDAAAPSLAEVAATGVLATYADCVALMRGELTVPAPA
ncbi:dTDP-4-dehydrorhamnose 3,5-epimerase family protein [Actinoplanes utahensis]|uniref:dTDP-4-dehydrorhamnose 3,5-epimerase n=1 Tax=Actinoplanes utahensis TaxID=1869 RepID=A0A0A6UGL8_ACTUT|nr:dTDP-4-dehydrorhamnose 3,5-epimerase [Actinoplanes utahensis]KHD74223.1 dTDP-4-dehydrorhamnose 3,5-epimerase [Actinoplanes utahensis]GIF35595.1 dTDP-4-dehydrorhamnose 3,5-epimerase [Actinoplanes utahensis]